MGMFYILSNIDCKELSNFIGFSKPKIKWNDNDEQYISCKYVEYKEIYNNLVCTELLPNKINIYSGYCFQEMLTFKWDNGQDYLRILGFDRCTNYILKECYSSLMDAIEGVEEYCKTVAHNKAEYYLLQGGSPYE